MMSYLMGKTRRTVDVLMARGKTHEMEDLVNVLDERNI